MYGCTTVPGPCPVASSHSWGSFSFPSFLYPFSPPPRRSRPPIAAKGSVLSRPPSIGGKITTAGGSTIEREVESRPRRRRRRGGGEWGEGIPLPSRLGGLGERRELPQRGPGQSPGRKRIWCTLELSESR